MEKQHDIVIIDNAVPKSLADEVENTIINPHFPYFYTFLNAFLYFLFF